MDLSEYIAVFSSSATRRSGLEVLRSSSVEAEDVARGLRDLGFGTVVVGGDQCRTGEQMRLAVAAALGFEEHYSWNWDAFYDALYEWPEDVDADNAILLFSEANNVLSSEPESRDLAIWMLQRASAERFVRAQVGAKFLTTILMLGPGDLFGEGLPEYRVG